MRAVTLADIEAALRVLLVHPQAARAKLASDLVTQAHVADKYRKRLAQSHPQFGAGTLMSAAAKHPCAKRPARFDTDTIEALATLLDALASRRVI